MRINTKKLVNIIFLLQIVCVLFVGIINSYSSNLAILKIIPDMLNLILLIILIQTNNYKICLKNLTSLVFLSYVGLSILWGDMSTYDVINQARRYFSAVLIYYMSSKMLMWKYWEKGVDLLVFAQIINVFITGYQHFGMHIQPDFCNGIFGFTTYANGMQGMLSLIISIVAIVYFIDEKWSVIKTSVAIGTSCVICAFAEVKAYYVLLVIAFILIIMFRFNNAKARKKVFDILLLLAFLLIVAYKILEVVLPDNLAVFFNIRGYIGYENYGAQGGAGRLTTLRYIYNNVYMGDIMKTLFGLGLGSSANGYAYTVGKLFISFGAIGIILLGIWYAEIVILNIKRIKKSESLICTVMIAMLVITLFVWNGTFTSFVFIIFWVLGCSGLTTDETRRNSDS